jgi:hypothetical protein
MLKKVERVLNRGIHVGGVAAIDCHVYSQNMSTIIA